jgi:hypothetical protein
MLNTRRHQKRFYDRKIHLPGREMLDVSRTNSLRELGLLFGIDETRYNEIVQQRTSITPEEWDALQLKKINDFSAEIPPNDRTAGIVNVPAPPPENAQEEDHDNRDGTSGGEPCAKRSKIDDEEGESN